MNRATALAKLANPEGEVVLTRAAYNQGVIQMLPTLASCSLDVFLPLPLFYYSLINKQRRK